MKTTMQETIAKAIEMDAALHGFSPDWLPDSAKFRLGILASRGYFDTLDDSEIGILLSLYVDPVDRFEEIPDNGDPWAYLVFRDRSLYYVNNAQDEVWADVYDFILERLLWGCEPRDYPPDSAEAQLIKAYF
jgi:hypothetical protein